MNITTDIITRISSNFSSVQPQVEIVSKNSDIMQPTDVVQRRGGVREQCSKCREVVEVPDVEML